MPLPQLHSPTAREMPGPASSLFEFDARQPSRIIAGVDEVGRGPLAGPVVAAAVCLDYSRQHELASLHDSKKLTPRARARLAPLIRESALAFEVAFIWQGEVDRLNIHHASLQAMRKALDGISGKWDRALVDGRFQIPGVDPHLQTAVIKGDSKSAAIAAASVLAKTARDEWMEKQENDFPGYGFARHKGYPTAQHIRQIKALGLCPLHRRTFCRKFVEQASSKS